MTPAVDKATAKSVTASEIRRNTPWGLTLRTKGQNIKNPPKQFVTAENCKLMAAELPLGKRRPAQGRRRTGNRKSKIGNRQRLDPQHRRLEQLAQGDRRVGRAKDRLTGNDYLGSRTGDFSDVFAIDPTVNL